jgi:hypothetical protein
MIEKVVWNISSLLLMIIYKTHEHYDFLQLILKWKLFAKVNKMPSGGLG